MQRTLKSTMLVGLAVAFAGCVLPEYSVDESLGSVDAGPVVPELPPPPPSCGGTGGPAMVAVRGGYCIDSTEVTWAQYMIWANGVMADPGTTFDGQRLECSWNMDLMPPPVQGCEEPLGEGAENRPVVCVDWCDAVLYCESVGKRLCGKIGGGDHPFLSSDDSSVSQWMNTCSSGNRNKFPYGNTYEATTCQTSGNAPGQPIPVGAKTDCQSSVSEYEGVFDLSGNISEWEDSCDGKVDSSDKCKARGGSFKEDNDGAACAQGRILARDTTVDHVGFRCCWEPPPL